MDSLSEQSIANNPSPVQAEAKSPLRRPQVLAPAGGREQFFAALQSGADAIYLGLNRFNARARATNFTVEDLYELAPIARKFDVNILITLNILIKEREFLELGTMLAELQFCDIHALIVQDLGVAAFIRNHFPGFRLHASTQLAIHNYEGVVKAWECGFSRVVLARELTILEIKKIRQKLDANNIPVELEVFCHGSLCYSYSGLCFFSGADDARSGNRGECAYTCRKPYKILSEPGHGFLFSMKDLNTVDKVAELTDAGVHTLKIEGRKKDAQYVMSSVSSYREALDNILGPKQRPALLNELLSQRTPLKDLEYSFSRGFTGLFTQHRYHENVIDLNNPTHKGVEIGRIEKIKGRQVFFTTQVPLELYDGIRMELAIPVFHAQPQHGDLNSNASEIVGQKGQVQRSQSDFKYAQKKYENDRCEFSLRTLTVDGKSVTSASAKARVSIEIPDNCPLPKAGAIIYKARSNELKRVTEKLSLPPPQTRLLPWKKVHLKISARAHQQQVNLVLCAVVHDQILAEQSYHFDKLMAEKGSFSQSLIELFSMFGNAQIHADIDLDIQENYFIPSSQLKRCKRDFEENLAQSITAHIKQKLNALNSRSDSPAILPLDSSKSAIFAIKIDRRSWLPTLINHLTGHSSLQQIVFEPKRAFVPLAELDTLISELAAAKAAGIDIMLSLPMVFRIWDLPYHRTWLKKAIAAGITRFEVGNLGALKFLEENVEDAASIEIVSDFTLYGLNSNASRFFAKGLGIGTVTLSVEDDLNNIRDHIAALHSTPSHTDIPQLQAILFKDTPLFIAESCSLTALHNGCPGSDTCGYRSLEIENDRGERFMVAHEACRSIVYGKVPYSISEFRHELQKLGIYRFRIDFLTRPYSESEIITLIDIIQSGKKVPTSHSANLLKTLL